jgi:hypothetical protein
MKKIVFESLNEFIDSTEKKMSTEEAKEFFDSLIGNYTPFKSWLKVREFLAKHPYINSQIDNIPGHDKYRDAIQGYYDWSEKTFSDSDYMDITNYINKDIPGYKNQTFDDL